MTDIVERLRDDYDIEKDGVQLLMNQAATEIETLRADRDRYERHWMAAATALDAKIVEIKKLHRRIGDLQIDNRDLSNEIGWLR